MKLDEALTLAAELAELSEIAQAAQSQDGRWELLQSWLAKNPAWKKRVTHWVKLPHEEAYDALRDFICERAEIKPAMLKLFITIETEAKARGAIALIQELYKERAGIKTKKEIAHESYQ